MTTQSSGLRRCKSSTAEGTPRSTAMHVSVSSKYFMDITPYNARTGGRLPCGSR
ncbi:MAG: hypothetical protein GX456_11165 [Verrucomicrobia bacterium]|nr:hypothetical protein [Verrucomicrobiota bacterium]